MKKLALAVAVPLALFGAATFYTSTQVESTARDAVDQANLKLREMGVGAGADVSLTLLSFERGLLSSTARYQIDIDVADDEGNTEHYALLLNDRLEHGPFPVSRLSRGQLMPVAAQSHFELERTPLTQKLFDAASGEVPLVGEVTIGYDGGQAGDLRTAALNIEDEDGSVRIASANLNFEANRDGSDVRMDGELAEIDIDLQRSDSGQPVQVSLRGIGLSADKQDYDDGFGFGPSAITLQRMEIKAGDEPAVVIQQASVEEALSRGSRGLDQTIGYRIGEVSAKGQTLRNLALVFSLRNLEESSLKALVASYKDILEQSATPQESFAGMTSAQQQELQARALQLLEHKPTLALDEFGFETAHGAARLSVVLDLQSPSAEAFTPDAMITSMLASLKADAGVDRNLVRDIAGLVVQNNARDGQLDQAALQQETEAATELFSGMALNTGWSRLERERLVSSLHYANDKVTFNGREMSVPEFLGFAFGSVQNAGLLGQ
ncbi:YdgA family protein [Stutzerimonas stutzeri]|uniref:YdgA family protein n=1 Tax=Stutzerimonas stutzeri TaxID=316 RepID=UPI002449BBF9|nr:YdgA family protein [Stutzerimonas stutzeri]MDH0214147.1 YdgA family protein [Stutzerimonas stutzeri]MDH0261775.1 YdgA family protein [Stutzerimonas stutzeri]MDH0503808.1 YdgA family protein [Stutzerimonas stutzeri]